MKISESKKRWIRDQWPYDVDMDKLEDPETSEAAEQDPYSDWSNQDLRDHLESFGLETKGNKDELKKRLMENDIGPNDEPE